ncbi:YtzC family protein [Bacillus sp. FJAT-42315]|uniref:YtzC family protein n=1 Tax=Bacillus sp. FJAT-42315 TaxID=2014077 RepID=UPI000C23B6A6|nr:YtzC family protein [Bacillus sp. FJAT-42315]
MATRQAVEQFIEQCKGALDFAEQQYKEASTQEHYNDVEFSQAQLTLEQTLNNLDKLSHSANSQQKEELRRMKLQIQQKQNEMILLDH